MLLACAAVVVVAAVVSLRFGSVSISMSDTVAAIFRFDGTDSDQIIVRSLRVPRTLLGLLVGASLGVAGVLMQTVTNNPLADPGLLGVNAGASLGVVLGIYVLHVDSLDHRVVLALAGAAVSCALSWLVSAGDRRGASALRLTLGGALTGALLSALTSAIILTRYLNVESYRLWIVGAVAGSKAPLVTGIAPVVGAAVLVSMLLSRSLNVLLLGDSVARGLGQRVGVVRLAATALVVVLAGGAVAVAGPIGFVGLAAPHVASGLVGSDRRWMLPCAGLVGSSIVVFADTVGRLVARPAEVQTAIMTAVFGLPFFVWFARRINATEMS